MPETLEKEPKIETVDSDDSDDEAPELEQGKEGADGAEGGAGGKQSKAEKKNRKAVQKLGMKLLTNIQQVTVKKSKTISFCIKNCDVYQQGDTFVVFGKIEDMSSQNNMDALQQAAEALSKGVDGLDLNKVSGDAAVADATADAAGGEEGGAMPDEKDIDLVMTQAGCSKEDAIKALKGNKNDIVEAIMSLQAA